MTEIGWKPSLSAFFAERAEALGRSPSLAELCWVSGRDARLWGEPQRHAELVNSIIELTGSGPASKILEVGCAAGYIAKGLAPRVRRYTGVDLAAAALRAARRMGLANACFKQADGGNLPFAANSFDAAFCYDVFTNLPSFADGLPIIRDMIRVVRPGGQVLIGSVPDKALQLPFEAKVQEVVSSLAATFGPPAPCPPRAKPKWRARLSKHLRREPSAVPLIVCYYFERDAFLDAGSVDATVRILPVHTGNPYAEYRFNAVYEKRPA